MFSYDLAVLTNIYHYLDQYRPAHIQTTYKGLDGIRRVIHALDLLWQPQHQYQVIHIAGTSGKGSTCQYLADGFRALRYKVWLTVSPHLIHVTERFVVQGQQISPAQLRDLLQLIHPVIVQTAQDIGQTLSYFEVLMVCAYTRFARCVVQIAVIETGLGGYYDASNVVTRPDKVCVLTDIGLDHTEILWPTLSDITYQKAMITHPGNHVRFHTQSDIVNQMIQTIVTQQWWFTHPYQWENLTQIDDSSFQTSFTSQIDDQDCTLSVYGGPYQCKNAHLALRVITDRCHLHDLSYDIAILANVLSQTRIPARHMPLQIADHLVRLDGAHNPQKMSAYIDYIHTLYPDGCHMILAYKQGKDWHEMMQIISPCAKSFGLIRMNQMQTDMRIQFVDPQDIVQYLESQDFASPVSILWDDRESLEQYIQTLSWPVLVTGSLYLAGHVLSHGYHR